MNKFKKKILILEIVHVQLIINSKYFYLDITEFWRLEKKSCNNKILTKKFRKIATGTYQDICMPKIGKELQMEGFKKVN